MSPNIMLQNLGKRRTYKMIGNLQNPEHSQMQNEAVIQAILDAAGNAPFHSPSHKAHQNDKTSPVPWRAYTLDANACRRLSAKLIEQGDATKIPNMLSASEYLIQVTWLPDPSSEDQSNINNQMFEATMRNMEHIAAASAFAQSLLLAGESEGFKTYWSSGGTLRAPETYALLGIPIGEILIGAVFLFTANPQFAEIRAGNLANVRGITSEWNTSVTID